MTDGVRCCPEMDVFEGECLACGYIHDLPDREERDGDVETLQMQRELERLHELSTESTPREHALARVRDALAALEQVPVAGVDAQKAATVRAVAGDLEAIETALTHEVAQQREDDDA